MTMATRFVLLAAALFAGAAGHDLRGSTVSSAEFDGTLDALEETVSDISPEDAGLARMLTDDNVTETTETATLTATTATVTATTTTLEETTTADANATVGETTTTLEETTTADANATVGETTTTPDAGSTVASTTQPLPVDGSFRQASVSAGLCALITAAFLAKQL